MYSVIKFIYSVYSVLEKIWYWFSNWISEESFGLLDVTLEYHFLPQQEDVKICPLKLCEFWISTCID